MISLRIGKNSLIILRWNKLKICLHLLWALLHRELIFMSVRSVRLLWLGAHLLGFTPSRGLFSPLLGCHHHTATTQTYTHRHTYKHRRTHLHTHLHTHRRTHKRTAHTSTITAQSKEKASLREHTDTMWTIACKVEECIHFTGCSSWGLLQCHNFFGETIVMCPSHILVHWYCSGWPNIHL